MRIDTLTSAAEVGTTHQLILELVGTDATVALPMTSTGTDTWSLDHSTADYDVQATITRGTTNLTLGLTSGTVQTALGPLTLTPTTVVLGTYPTSN